MPRKPLNGAATSERAQAEALGISRARVRHLRRDGMPWSIAESIRWRAANLDPSWPAKPLPTTDALSRAAELAAQAQEDFAAHEMALRAALKAIPRARRASFEMPPGLWPRLIDVERLRKWEALVASWDAGPPPPSIAQQDEEDFWWDPALGVIVLGPI